MEKTHDALPWALKNGRYLVAPIAGDKRDAELIADFFGESATDHGNAEFAHRACTSHYDLLAALEDVELRATQAGIAWGIAKKKKQTAFLLGELERLKAVARTAIAKAKHVPAPQLDYACKHCGSRNVFRDATAQWNVSAQAWEMVDVTDHADCGDCDGETTLQEIDLSKVTP